MIMESRWLRTQLPHCHLAHRLRARHLHSLAGPRPGESLGCGAILRFLLRLQSGDFHLCQAIRLEENRSRPAAALGLALEQSRRTLEHWPPPMQAEEWQGLAVHPKGSCSLSNTGSKSGPGKEFPVGLRLKSQLGGTLPDVYCPFPWGVSYFHLTLSSQDNLIPQRPRRSPSRAAGFSAGATFAESSSDANGLDQLLTEYPRSNALAESLRNTPDLIQFADFLP